MYPSIFTFNSKFLNWTIILHKHWMVLLTNMKCSQCGQFWHALPMLNVKHSKLNHTNQS